MLAALLAACTPSYVLPPTEEPPPTTTAGVARDWWKAFNEPVLDQLIAQAFVAAPSLASAVARVDAAQARLGASRSYLLPEVNGQLAGSRTRLSEETNPLAARREVTVYSGALVASWEVDLWGRIRNETAASESELLAARYGRDAVELALASQAARGYFELRALDAQLDVARRTLSTRATSYELRVKRFARGLISELDVRQAENELATARASIPDLQEAVARAEGSLAVLTGRSPRELFEATPRGADIGAIPIPPGVPEGLPSQLLLRRPDIQEAEATLRAAQARVAGARAAYFPVIGLTGSYGGESLALADLFSGPARTWSFAGSFFVPIFNSGRTAAQVDLATAGERSAAAAYRDTVIRAFAEVRGAIVAHRQASERVSARAQSIAAVRRSLRLATLRYDNGYSSYLDLLEAERSLFSAELAAVDARRAQLAAVVDLYRSLGGGWTP